MAVVELTLEDLPDGNVHIAWSFGVVGNPPTGAQVHVHRLLLAMREANLLAVDHAATTAPPRGRVATLWARTVVLCGLCGLCAVLWWRKARGRGENIWQR